MTVGIKRKSSQFLEDQMPRYLHTSCAFGGHDIPNEIFLLILEHLTFEDRAAMAVVCSQVRPLALHTLDKLKIMRDLPYCAPAPASTRAPGWLDHRVGTPARNMYRLQLTVARCSSILTYLNLLGTNILNQDFMAWIYQIDLPKLESFKFPNGTDLYMCLLRDLAEENSKWPNLNQLAIGFGSKLEVPEECLELVRRIRLARPSLKSNIARCLSCQRLYFTDSRVRCLLCNANICTQHFTRVSGVHCVLSRRVKCPDSGLKYHLSCASLHNKQGCHTLDSHGKHWSCYVENASSTETFASATTMGTMYDPLEDDLTGL